MKVTDLMVGDWVNVTTTNQPRKIAGTNDMLFHDEYDPIQLTEEILVKNGFGKRIYTSPSNNEDYRYYQWNPTPEYPDEGVWLWPDGDSYTYNSRISDIKINSVHQLQHLLKLVGVQKEIEL